MPIVVHQISPSPPARSVLVTAEILGLEIETRDVHILSGDNFKPEYLEKNPLHTVPLLEDGDFILADSHAIIIYLCSKYGAKRASELYPSDVQRRAIVHQRLFLDASILFPRLSVIVRGIAFHNEPDVVENKRADVEEAYGFLEKYLETSTFIGGENLTIADICCVTTVSSLNLLIPINGKYPKLQEWLNKLSNEDWYINKNLPGLNGLRDVINYFLQKNNTKLQI